jgi:bifunctional ADP-heptose synthase (sugar kinase/adenylyltransferase)
VIEPGLPPRELSRLDSKNWTPTPESLQHSLADRLTSLADRMDAILLMDQVDRPETGVVTAPVRLAAHSASRTHAGLIVLADSRQGLRHFPPLTFKMNAAELAACTGEPSEDRNLSTITDRAAELAERNGQPVFVTLAERGIIGAIPGLGGRHVPALPARGPIDIVGAGDSVTANLAAALAAGAEIVEAMELAMIAASIVIHQLGTTGTASTEQIAEHLALV